MLAKKFLILGFIFFFTAFTAAQETFTLHQNKKSVTVPFKLINNLMVIPVEVNGKKLSFLLDTGIEKTILFNLKISDSVRLNNVEQIQMRGLGEGDAIQALKSRGNLVRIKDAISVNHMIYMITDNLFDLSAKMGIDVNGIIGGDLFKDFVVRINYSSKKITFYNPDTYVYKRCKNCLTLPLEFLNKKPLLNASVENHLGDLIDVKLLIDSGGGDALWLFKNTHPKLLVSDRYFDDYLGKGLSGDIYGKRSVINKLKIGDFVFKNASVSYPDSTSIITVHDDVNRNGTVGAEILKRFHVIFDYPSKKLTLKKNGSNFKAPFLYNKSGIELIYNGEMLVQEKKSRFQDYELDSNKKSLLTEVMYVYNVAYRPKYEISHIRKGSPALFSGLLVGDILLEVNGRPAYEKELDEIIHMLSGNENKKIKLLIERNGVELKYEFELKNML